MQTRKQSLIESLSGTAIGFVGSLAITYSVMRFMDADLWTKTILTTALCTVWSIVRGYCLRRWFARRHG